MAPEAEAVRVGYMRQMAAKAYAWRHTRDPELVITDDDTEAIGSWGRGTFFDAGGRAQIWHKRHSLSFWLAGNRMLFGHGVEHDFQLLLPFAIRRETLEDFVHSSPGRWAMDAWRRGDLVSEFMAFGEYALREDPALAIGRDVMTDPGHWTHTLGSRPCFRDWQGFRRSFRKRIARAAALTRGEGRDAHLYRSRQFGRD
jgi:hypothetical protein